MRTLIKIVGSAAAALGALGACSSFSGDGDGTAPPPDGGPGPGDAPSEAATVDAPPPRCAQPKEPSTIGLYDTVTRTFALFAHNAAELPAVTVEIPEVNALPIAFHRSGAGDTVGWYSSSTHDFKVIAQNKTGALVTVTKNFGAIATAYRPFAGDWNQDGESQFGIHDPLNNSFFIDPPVPPGAGTGAFQFGAVPTDAGPPAEGRVVAGDWDGSGIDGVGLFVPSTGGLFLKNVADNGVGDVTIVTKHIGASFWPIAGDWDGCGPVRVGLYDAATGTVYLLRGNTNAEEDVILLGKSFANRLPVAGRWLKP